MTPLCGITYILFENAEFLLYFRLTYPMWGLPQDICITYGDTTRVPAIESTFE